MLSDFRTASASERDGWLLTVPVARSASDVPLSVSAKFTSPVPQRLSRVNLHFVWRGKAGGRYGDHNRGKWKDGIACRSWRGDRARWVPIGADIQETRERHAARQGLSRGQFPPICVGLARSPPPRNVGLMITCAGEHALFLNADCSVVRPEVAAAS